REQVVGVLHRAATANRTREGSQEFMKSVDVRGLGWAALASIDGIGYASLHHCTEGLVNPARALTFLLAPYAIWSAYWGAVSILARSPNPEHRDDSFDPDRVLMGNMRGAEGIAIIASLFYGVLGAGPMEYSRYRRVLAEHAKEPPGAQPHP
ncbi:MAG: hypothetical protein MPN21_28095, partial [Thermoanaerobaculia bacterium]|nr:hypothetical protein [Thermoanaerobaculia bacterium]